VNISIKGKPIGTVSNMEGNFSLKIISEEHDFNFFTQILKKDNRNSFKI
jgi:hypothetical protein